MEYEYNDDVGINIGNLIYRVLRRWRLIIVWIILGAIALDAFAYLKTMKKAADIKQRISDYQESVSSNGTESVNLEELGKNLTDKQKKNRKLLEKIMVDSGFVPLKSEWWHFSLKNEPFPNTYFDFNVE
jgi:hypothetical protein